MSECYGPDRKRKGSTFRRIITFIHDAADTVGETIRKIAKWAAEHPKLVACVVVGAISIAIIAQPELASVPVLHVLGFTSEGIQAGTSVSAIHSSIGNIAVGSLFATAQSAGAGGAGIAFVNGLVQVGGIVSTAAISIFAWLKSKF